jgi:hypothetical protein
MRLLSGFQKNGKLLDETDIVTDDRFHHCFNYNHLFGKESMLNLRMEGCRPIPLYIIYHQICIPDTLLAHRLGYRLKRDLGV